MKNFIIIGLVLFVAWVFLGKKAEAKKDEILGDNTSNGGNRAGNEDGGANMETRIVEGATDIVNNLIDHAFNYAQKNNPPNTGNNTI